MSGTSLREQVVLRDRTCVFPRCTPPARRADLDHINPHDHGGETSSKNIAPLCRRHHRLKTLSRIRGAGWSYRMLEAGVYEWTSPHGHTFIRERPHTSTETGPP